MSLKQTITEIVEKHLPDESHYVVDIQVIEKGVKPQVKILIDADGGLKIDTCAKVSRKVGNEIEENGLLPEAYVLEVSSPGIDYPLTTERQYRNNIGRKIKVTLIDNTEIEGELEAVEPEIVRLKTKKQKGKKADDEQTIISLEQIKKSIVLVSFN